MGFAGKYLSAAWEMTAEMAPYLLVGFAIAGLLKKLMSQAWIQKTLGQGDGKSIVAASLVGVPLPLCSCGVIPVTASLRHNGASKGASASFLASTPQTGVDSILATYGMLGPLFAIYRVIVALLSGVFTGYAVQAVSKPDQAEHNAKPQGPEDRSSWLQALRYGLIELPGDIANSLIVGILLAALISAFAPPDMLSAIPGGAIASILLITLIAVPLYVCSTGSIPLAVALVENGLPASAALVLLIAGPATNMATIATMRQILGSKETITYLSCIIVSAWIAAFAFEYFFVNASFATMPHHSSDSLGTLKTLSAIALIAILLWAPASVLLRSKKNATAAGNEIVTLRIEGMTCQGCATKIERELMDTEEGRSVHVNLKQGLATINGTNLDASRLSEHVINLGYRVISSQKAEN